MSRVLRLSPVSGPDYVARLVLHGEAYGDDRRRVNEGYGLVVEFVMPTGSGGHTIAVFQVEELPPLVSGWAPNHDPDLALPAEQVERLRGWLADPSSLDDEAVAVVVGYDDELAKVALALGRIGLESLRVPDAGRVLAMARLLPPTLVVVGQDTLRFEPLDLVRRLRAVPETREVPVVVLGGDAAEAAAVGATLHEPVPPDYARLAERVAALLDFV